MSPAKLTQLLIYPVKSLSGIAVDEVQVTGKGLAGDREWMLVNAAGRFVTQRQVPKLATVKVALTPSGVRLTHPTAGSVDVDAPAPDAPVREVKIWEDNCAAHATNAEVSHWLDEVLGEDNNQGPIHLVKFAEGFVRPGKPERFGDATTRFADAAPFLVANQSSLDALNQHLQKQDLPAVDMRHFRPNLVADGLPAFGEHGAEELHLQGSSLSWQLCDACQRCSIITVDPDSGERAPKAVPFKQLAYLNPMPDNPKAPAFGINARLLRGDGLVVRTGSEVSWLARPSV